MLFRSIMSMISHHEHHWARKVHAQLYPTSPYIALGSIGAGLPTMIRRLYSYIENYGSPKEIYMTVARFDGYEAVSASGKCYGVSDRHGSAYFMHEHGVINDEELAAWVSQLSTNKKTINPYKVQYILEERFAFIETICRLHKINLHWTFNPSDACVVVLQNNLAAVNDISQYMKDSFVGLPAVVDHENDRSIGPETHANIFDKFMTSESWNFQKICDQSAKNLEWLKSKYGDILIHGMRNE